MEELLSKKITLRLQEIGDEAFISRLLTIYRQQSDLYIEEMATAFEEEDVLSARKILHKMSGACSVVGAQAMLSLLEEARQAVKFGPDWSRARQTIPSLLTVNEQTIDELRSTLTR